MPKLRLRQKVTTTTINVTEDQKQRIMDNGCRIGTKVGIPVVKLDSYAKNAPEI